MTPATEIKQKPAELLEHRKPEEQQRESGVALHPLLQLQRHAGNRAVAQWLEPGIPPVMVQRKCKTCTSGSKCAACEEEEEERVQRKAKTAFLGTPQIQRAARNGDASAVDAEAGTAGGLLVPDDATTVAPGQMRKSDFLEQLRSTVCATADEALAAAGQSSEGCPYIEQWLSYYADQEPAHVERALRKFAPEAANATSARDYIPAISNRVRVAVERWAKTGEITGVPPEMEGMFSGGTALGAVAGALGSIGSAIGGAISSAAGAIGSAFSKIGKALFKRKEGPAKQADDPQEIRAQLSGGHPLDASSKSRLGSAFGQDFSGVRVHTGAQAAGLSDQLNARAFTIGNDIAFGAGEYQPGTLIGDALIAHELAHVVQQGGATSKLSPATTGVPDESTLEADADSAAISAVSSIWSTTGAIAASAIPRVRSGLSLSRCTKKAAVKSPADVKSPKDAKSPAGAKSDTSAGTTCKIQPAVEKLKREIITTFKLSSVTESGEACWTAAELIKMRDALTKIPTEQRNAIAGVSLVRVTGIADCSASGPQGCFKEKIDPATGERADTIQIADAALAMDKDFEDGSKSYRNDRSGARIETLPSQDVLLHEVGHAVETANERAAESARIPPQQEAVKSADLVKTITEEINQSKPPSFKLTFSANREEAAYQRAVIAASKKVGAMVDTIEQTGEASADKISDVATAFKKALKSARTSIADLKIKKAALPSGSSVTMEDIEGPMEAQVEAGGRLAIAFDARIAAQKKLDPAEKAVKRAKAKIKFKDHGTEAELDITRSLAELVAMVMLKGINIATSRLEEHPTTNWPQHPEELYADLYQMSISEPKGLKSFDTDIAQFFASPIGPKGTWADKVDKWIVSHTIK